MTSWADKLTKRFAGYDVSSSRYTDRAATSAAVLSIIRPHFAQLGITRLGEISELSEVFVPVAFACRPNSFSLSISLGKGLTSEQARAAAAMEAVETAIAERKPASAVTCSARELSAAGKSLVDVSRIARCWPHLIDASESRDWVVGVDLISGETVHVPWDLVKLDHRTASGEDVGPFEVTSDGLASGTCAVEAVFHALCELIERDALALFELGFQARCAPPAYCAATLDDARLDAFLAKLRDAGIDLYLIDITSDIGIPAWLAVTHAHAPADGDTLSQKTFFGAASNPNSKTAAISAALEAIQARSAYIAGARDDFTADEEPSAYVVGDFAGKPAILRNIIQENPESLQHDIPSGTTLGELVGGLLDRLLQRGIDQVIVVNLPTGTLDVSVVRVIVPDLLVPLHGIRTQVLPRGILQALGNGQ